MKFYFKPTIFALSLGLLGAQPLLATLVVYEGFNYGGTSGAIDGQAVGGGALGLSGSYTTKTGTTAADPNPPNTQTATYLASGLSFAGLSTSGGALEMSVIPTIADSKEYAYTHVPFNATATGDIYQSFLVNLSANNLTGTSYGDSLIRNQATASMLSNGNGAMSVYGNKPSADQPSVGYDADTTTTGSSLVEGTTYLFISKFTNVGGMGGGDSSLWVLDNDGYNDWMSLGGGLEANLDTYDTMKASRSSTNDITFDTTRSLRISVGDFYVDYNSGSANYAATGELTVIYDELRYGTSLESITVIPEPSTFSLLLLSGFGFFSLWRLHRKRL